MVTVKRYNHPEKTLIYKNGKTKTVPEFYECYYYYDNKAIATYDSRLDTLYLATRYILKDRSMSDYNRALNGEFKEAYTFLFNMLGIDETSQLSEFSNI